VFIARDGEKRDGCPGLILWTSVDPTRCRSADTNDQRQSGLNSILTQATLMNPYLPPEILDYIVDLLHGEPEALKECCLVSTSWVSRTRKHLFAHIRFRSADDLRSWKKTFQDVANSPARHTHTLSVGRPRHVVAADAEEGGWIQAFSGVASLDVDSNHFLEASEVSLTPFHRFSPTLKSLHIRPIRLPYPQLFDLICSFPLLEDLNLKGGDGLFDGDDYPHGSQTVAPSTSPPFTGSLSLNIYGGLGEILRQLLDLPNGLHFRTLTFLWDREKYLRWIRELVVKCSHTLESLDVAYIYRCTSIRICDHTNNLIVFLVAPASASFSLSKATKLRDAAFRPDSQNIEWVIMALETITPEHQELRQISIYVPYHLTLYNVGADIRQSLGEKISRRWSDLDRLLVQFWESRSIRPRVGCVRVGEEGQNTEHLIGCLLPETTKRGIVDPV